MVALDLRRADEANWAQVATPTGKGLASLPASVWNSREIRDAVAQGNPGAVIAVTRRAHGLNQAQLGGLAGFSQSAISRIESGGNLAFDLRLLRVFQRILGIPPSLLGLSTEVFPLPVADVRQLLGPYDTRNAAFPLDSVDAGAGPYAVDQHTLAAACTSAVLAALPVDTLGAMEENRPVDPDVIHRLLVIRRLLNDSDNWLGSRHLARTVRDLYGLIDRVRRATSGELRRQLLDVAALYAEFCGWLHQEVGDLRGGMRWTERALQQAQAADDRQLVAYTYVRLGHFAGAEGDGDRVVGLARAAQREPDLSAQVRAIALQAEAHGHAAVSNETPCLTRLDEALTVGEEMRTERVDEYRVGYYFTKHHLYADRAACLLELGRWQETIDLYRAHEAGRATLCDWEQGAHLARLARAHAETGEFEQAGVLGFEALAIGRRVGSVIVTDQLRKLDTWQEVPAIAALTSALDPVA
jgi:transcriptional regulator with XRE-family HTH domain